MNENTTNAMSNDINESDSYSDGVPVAQPTHIETIEDSDGEFENRNPNPNAANAADAGDMPLPDTFDFNKAQALERSVTRSFLREQVEEGSKKWVKIMQELKGITTPSAKKSKEKEAKIIWDDWQSMTYALKNMKFIFPDDVPYLTPREFHDFKQKTIEKIVKNINQIPKFKDGADPNLFINLFENLWDNQDFLDPEKLIAMRFSFEEGSLPFLWYENNIATKLQNLSWDNVRHSFLKNYKNADYRGMNIFKIFQIKLKNNEKVSQFTGRYLQAMKNAGWDRYDSHASSQNNHLIGVAKRVLWLRLPPSVRQNCQLKGLRDYKNVKELALAVNRYPGTPPDLDKIVDDGQPDCEVISVKCLYHPQTSHSATQCTLYLKSVNDYHSKKRGFSDSVNNPEKKIRSASAIISNPQLNSNIVKKNNYFEGIKATKGICVLCKTPGWTKEKRCVNPSCGKPSPRPMLAGANAGVKAGDDSKSTSSSSYEEFFTSIKGSSHYFNSSLYMRFINENPLNNTNPSEVTVLALATNKADRHHLPGEERFSMVPVP